MALEAALSPAPDITASEMRLKRPHAQARSGRDGRILLRRPQAGGHTSEAAQLAESQGLRRRCIRRQAARRRVGGTWAQDFTLKPYQT